MTHDQDAIALAERVLAILEEGSFSSTYKYALFIGILDLCIEKTDGQRRSAIVAHDPRAREEGGGTLLEPCRAVRHARHAAGSAAAVASRPRSCGALRTSGRGGATSAATPFSASRPSIPTSTSGSSISSSGSSSRCRFLGFRCSAAGGPVSLRVQLETRHPAGCRPSVSAPAGVRIRQPWPGQPRAGAWQVQQQQARLPGIGRPPGALGRAHARA